MLSLRTLLIADFVIAFLSCVPLLFMPDNMKQIYGLCKPDVLTMASRECQMITLLSALFNGRNVCVVAILYFAITTKDHATRRGIAWTIMFWCFYMVLTYVWIGANDFIHSVMSIITVAMLTIFGCLYMIVLMKE